MSSVWPGALDNFTLGKLNSDSSFNLHPGMHNEERDAINKIEAELGLDPSGAYATVRARLDAIMASGYTLYNVKTDAAAIGNGVADDTSTVQGLVNAHATSGATIFFPDGNYSISSLTIPHNAKIKFLLANGATITQKALSDRCLFYHESNAGADSADTVWIEGGNLVGEGMGVAGFGVRQRGAAWLDNIGTIVMRNVNISGFRDVGVNCWPKGLVWIENVNAKNCCSTDQGWNVINWCNSRPSNESTMGPFYILFNEVDTSDNGGISASSVPNSPAIYLKAYVLGNTVKNCSWTGIALESRYWSQVLMTHNYVYNCWSSIEVGTGGGTDFPNLSQQNYHLIAMNTVDMQLRTSGAVATGSCLNIAGSRLIVTKNILIGSRTGILLSATGTGSFADDIICEGNIFVSANGDTTRTEPGIWLLSNNQMRRIRITNNIVTRLTARVMGGQVVGAGGQLQVDTVAGWPSSGTIIVKGVSYAYTAITQAVRSPAANAKITVTPGITVNDGDLVFTGGMGAGIAVATGTRNAAIHFNSVVNPGERGIQSGGINTVISYNTVINPASQNRGGDEHGILLNGGGVDQQVKDNTVIDETGAPNSITAYGVTAGETRPSFSDNYADGYSTLFAYDINATPVYWRNNRKSSTHTPDGGIFTSTPGAVSTVNIPHGLPASPKLITVEPGDANARGAPPFYRTADGTNIILTFSGNLNAATSYTWNWTARV